MARELQDWIKTRRTSLGLSQVAAASACITPARRKGVHRQTWRAWEQGEAVPEEFNFVGIEAALRWTAGSVAAILAGGDPTPLEEEEAEPLLFDDTERDLWAVEGLPEAMKWEVILARRNGKARPTNEGGGGNRRHGT
jgi:transcriptional regulator with XRE-family HTH domain